MDVLNRIKQLILQNAYVFTTKAQEERDVDNLLPSQVLESIINARAISKTLRSRSGKRRYAGEKRYVIKSFSFDGTYIYTKGAIRRDPQRDTFYILISAKIATS